MRLVPSYIGRVRWSFGPFCPIGIEVIVTHKPDQFVYDYTHENGRVRQGGSSRFLGCDVLEPTTEIHAGVGKGGGLQERTSRSSGRLSISSNPPM